MSEPIIVEQTFRIGRSRLWEVLTDPTYMRQWFFSEIPDFKAENGFTTKFLVDAGERQFIHLWTITEVIPETRIVYAWRYDGYTGDGTVIFELSDQESGSLLRLTNLGIESFPNDIPEFSADSCRGGWQYFINGRLVDFIDKVF